MRAGLIALLFAYCFSQAEDFCDNPSLDPDMVVPAPEIQSARGQNLTVKIRKMSNGAWPARLQVLATETPGSDHGQDCFLRSKDRGKSCVVIDGLGLSGTGASVNKTINFQPLPAGKRHSFFVRALACASDSLDYGSGWGSGKGGVEFVQNAADTTLRVQSLDEFTSAISFAVPTVNASTAKLELIDESLLKNLNPAWKTISLSATSSSSSIVHSQQIGNFTRFDVVLNLKSLYTTIPARLLARLDSKKEVAFAVRPDKAFSHMVASLVLASQNGYSAFWPSTGMAWESMNQTDWLYYSDLLYMSHIVPEKYDDILVRIANEWSNASGFDKKTRIREIVDQMDRTIQEPQLRLQFHRGSNLTLSARNYVRLQILGTSFSDLWKPGRRIQLFRGENSNKIKIENLFTSATSKNTRQFYPYTSTPIADTLKGVLDTGMVIVPGNAESYGMLARVAPAYFDAPMSPFVDLDAQQLSKLQVADVVKTEILGDEILNGKKLPGVLVLQPNAASKYFDLKKPVYSYRAEVFGESCANTILATVEASANALPKLRLTATGAIPSTQECTLRLTELDQDSKPVQSMDKQIVSSNLFFPDFSVAKSILVSEGTPVEQEYNLQLHNAIKAGTFGKAKLEVNLVDDYFEVGYSGNGEFPLSLNLSPSSSAAGKFTVSPRSGGRTELVASLYLEGRSEPVLRQAITLSSVSIENSLEDLSGSGLYLYQTLPYKFKYTPVPQDGRSWKIRTKLERKSGTPLAQFDGVSGTTMEFDPTGGNGEYVVNLTPSTTESESIDDHRLVSEYGYSESGTWVPVAADTILFTVANCKNASSGIEFRKMGNTYRYVLNSLTPVSSKPDPKGLCSYSAQPGLLRISTFGLTNMGQLPNKEFSIFADLTTKAIGDEILTLSATANANETFAIGANGDFIATLGTLKIDETMGINGQIGNMSGSIEGELTLDHEMVLGASDFKLNSGLNAEFAVDLAAKTLLIQNVENVRLGQTYQVNGLASTPLTVFFGNYLNTDPAVFSASADQFVIRGNLLHQTANITAPADVVVSVVAGKDPIQWEYHLLTGKFRIYGSLDAQVDLTVHKTWLGLSDLICPASVPTEKLHQHFVWNGSGNLTAISQNWDDVSICGKLNYTNLFSEDLTVGNMQATYDGYTGGSVSYQWPSLKMSLSANVNYVPSVDEIQNWTNVSIAGSNIISGLALGTASITNGSALTGSWSTPILLDGTSSIQTHFSTFGLSNTNAALNWIWNPNANLLANALDLPIPLLQYNILGSNITLAPSFTSTTNGGNVYSVINQASGVIAVQGKKGEQAFACIYSNGVGLGYGCKAGKATNGTLSFTRTDAVLYGYRERTITTPAWSWSGVLDLVKKPTSNNGVADIAISNDTISDCKIGNHWWKESSKLPGSLLRTENQSAGNIEMPNGIRISPVDDKLSVVLSGATASFNSRSDLYELNIQSTGCAKKTRTNTSIDVAYLRLKEAVTTTNYSKDDAMALDETDASSLISLATSRPQRVQQVVKNVVLGYPVSMVVSEKVASSGKYNRTIKGSFASLSKINLQGQHHVDDGVLTADYIISGQLDKLGIGYLQVNKTESSEAVMVDTKTFFSDPVAVTVKSNNYTWVMPGILTGTLTEQWVSNSSGNGFDYTMSGSDTYLQLGTQNSIMINLQQGATP